MQGLEEALRENTWENDRRNAIGSNDVRGLGSYPHKHSCVLRAIQLVEPWERRLSRAWNQRVTHLTMWLQEATFRL